MKRIQLLTAVAVLSALSGCLMLSPDESPRRSLDLRFVARADALDKAPCGDPDVLLNSEDLLARVIISQRKANGGLTEIARSGLKIGPLLNGERLLTGEIEIPVDPAAEREIRVELLYTGPAGRDPFGEWTGDVAFASGPRVKVESFVVRAGQGQALAGDVVVSFAGDVADRVSFNNLIFNLNANRLAASYRVDDVDWDDSGVLRDIIAEMEMSFAPTIIFSAQEPLAALAAGAGQVETTIELQPTGTPTLLGRDLSGRISLRFADGLPPTESGVVALRRVDTTCNGN